MVLEDFALLAADTARTKAYLHAMIQENKLPGICVVYSDNISGMQKEAEKYENNRNEYKYFNVERPVLSYIKEVDMPYVLVDNKDINSEQIKSVIQNLQQKYLIYSGYGGYLLKPHLFQTGKKFIHVHAGILPKYRGSTTVYYSFLQEKTFGATAIFLSEGIDEGKIIAHETFDVPKESVNIDYIYEPYLRSKVLMKVINRYLSDGGLTSDEQCMENAETYFIIHPVLKHIAMLGIEKAQSNGNSNGGKYEDSHLYTARGNS